MTNPLRFLLSMLAKDLRMAIEIVVPTLGKSVTEATVGKWFKKAGDAVKADEALAELETDKVTLEVNAPAAGVISEIVVKEGETVAVGAVLGSIAEGARQPRLPRQAWRATGTDQACPGAEPRIANPGSARRAPQPAPPLTERGCARPRRETPR